MQRLGSPLFWITALLALGGSATRAVTEDDKLVPPDPFANQYFGFSVAVSETTVVVGATGEGGNIGAAYVFDCSSFPCLQVSRLTASDGQQSDQLGSSVAVHGTTAVVGASTAASGGAVYSFDLSTCGAECTETSKLTASDGASLDYFGASVAVSGTTAVVGAWRDDDSGPESGSAYYFDLSLCGPACTETGKLTASDGAEIDLFGVSVAVSGTTAAVGAPGDDDAGDASGSAYYFDLSTCGAACTETGKLTASDAAMADEFGISVAVGETIAVVGSHGDDDTGEGSGSAYHFDLPTCGAACTEAGKLRSSDAAAGDVFGGSVALSGGLVVVGASGDDDSGDESGSAYSFDLANCGPDCTETVKLLASDGALLDALGAPVSVSGNLAVAGAVASGDPGSAYVFALPPAGGDFALEFDGTDDLVSFGTVNPVSSHTIEAWVRLGAAVERAIIAGQVAGPGQACSLGMSLRTDLDDPTLPCYGVDISGCGNGTVVCGDSPIDGVWRHLAGTYDGDTMRLYVNGRLAAQQSAVPFDPSTWMTAGAVTFFNGNQSHFPGRIDEIRVWDVVRTQQEIRSTIHRPLRGDEPGLVGYWTMDEGAGQEVADSSGSGVTGFLGESDAVEAKDPAWVESQALRVPVLSATGTCPGTTTIEISNAGSNARLVLLRGPAEGGPVELPTGPCVGTEIGLASPALVSALTADENGELTVERELPASACGLFLQAVDTTNCAASDVAQLP